MSHIIIAGVPRSGKTTLARRLNAEFGVSIVTADALVSTLDAVFPEHGITHFGDDHAATCRAFRGVFHEFVRHLAYERHRFVVDVYHMLPADLADLAAEAPVLFLGYADADPQTKLSAIRRHERPHEWSADLTDPQLLQLIHRFIHESAAARAACADLPIRYIETGTDFDRTLDDTYEHLRTHLADQQ